jgi:hypothetical protein
MQAALKSTLILTLALISPLAAAQAHTLEEGPYTVRSSTVSSLYLAPSTASEHGIERGPNTAVLNVTVLHGPRTVPATVQARARDLNGTTRAIPMRETVSDQFVSYTGSYTFVHGEVLDFLIDAQPKGAKAPLSMRYRERMWAEGAVPVPLTR